MDRSGDGCPIKSGMTNESLKMTQSEIQFDQPLIFTLPHSHARGRFVRLGPVLDLILSAHGYPPAIERVLADALTLTALLGSTLKDADGQLTLQAQTENGLIELLVCDYKAGELRGYLKFDPERAAEMPEDPSLFALFGKGYLGITFDQAASGERYQGIVPLDGENLAEAAQAYFVQSDQLPTLIRLATRHDKGAGCIAGGMLVQFLPDGEEGRERLHTLEDNPAWDHVRALAETMTAEELTDPALSLEALTWRLFHEEEEIRVLPGAPIVRGCRCNADYLKSVIARFPAEERTHMADADGNIVIDCAFCSKLFPIPLDAAAA